MCGEKGYTGANLVDVDLCGASSMTWIGSLRSPAPNLHTGMTSRVQSGGRSSSDQPRMLENTTRKDGTTTSAIRSYVGDSEHIG